MTTEPASVFHQKDALRRSIIASYWFLVFLALPLWWNTTSIHRLALPVLRVHSHAQHHVRLPVHIRLTSNVSSAHLKSLVDAGLDVQIHSDEEALGTYTIIDSPRSFVDGRTLHYPAANHHLSDVLSSLLAPVSSSRDIEYSPRYRLAFSLLNEDAAAGGAIVGWDISRAIQKYFSPISKQLAVLHNFTIESQVQFHAPLAFKPTQLQDGTFGLTQEQLTLFVNSAEWSLSSSASNDPVLHFILFVPSINQSPLRILSSNSSSSSTTFLLPQWGTILIYNPPPHHDTSQPTQLSLSDLDPIFQSFADQLLALLGVPALPFPLSSSPANPPNAILTDWQLDALMRRRTLENAQKAKDTLQSIVNLVDEIQNMPVEKDVRDDVVNALNELDEMYTSSHQSLTRTLQHSARALTLASRAFFNPSMLALLYFPAEHKYAVYTPLFASAMIPMVVTVLREVKAWRAERAQ